MSATVESMVIDLDMVAVGSDMERGVLDLARAMLKAQGARVAELEAMVEDLNAKLAELHGRNAARTNAVDPPCYPNSSSSPPSSQPAPTTSDLPMFTPSKPGGFIG